MNVTGSFTSDSPSGLLIASIFVSSRILPERDRRGGGGRHLWAPGGHASHSDHGFTGLGDPQRGETAWTGYIDFRRGSRSSWRGLKRYKDELK